MPIIYLVTVMLRTDSTVVDAHLLLAQIYVETDSLERAAMILERAARLGPLDPRVHHLLGTVAFGRGRFRQAIRHFRESLERNKSQEARRGLSMSSMNRGVELLREGRIESALRHFDAAVETDRTNLLANRNRVVVLTLLDRLDDAQRTAEEALRVHRGDRDLLSMLIRVRRHRKDFEGALEAAEDLFRFHPEDVDAGLELAYLLRFNNQGERALAVYESLLQKAPHDRRIYDALADLHAVRSDLHRAVAVYEELLETTDDISVWKDIGDLRARGGDSEGAIRDYRRALKGLPSDAKVYHRIATEYGSAGIPDKAAETYREAVARLGADRSLYLEWGRVLENVDGTRAAGVYKEMTEIWPEDPVPHVRLGSLHTQIDSASSQSALHFLAAVELDSEDPLPFHSLAEFAAIDGDTVSAVALERDAIARAVRLVERLRSGLVAQLGGEGWLFSEEVLTDIDSSADSLSRAESLMRDCLDHFLLLGNPADRERDLRDLASDHPNAGILVEYRGRILEYGGWMDEAEALYTDLLSSEPDNIHAQLALARIWERGGSIEKAIAAYRRALVLDAGDSALYEKLVELYRDRGRMDELIEAWLVEARRSPDNRVLLETLIGLLEEAGRMSDLQFVRAIFEGLE